MSKSVLIVAGIIGGLIMVALVVAIVICLVKTYRDKRAARVRQLRPEHHHTEGMSISVLTVAGIVGGLIVVALVVVIVICLANTYRGKRAAGSVSSGRHIEGMSSFVY